MSLRSYWKRRELVKQRTGSKEWSSGLRMRFIDKDGKEIDLKNVTLYHHPKMSK